MFCQGCGRVVEDSFLFCPFCGRKSLSNMSSSNSNVKRIKFDNARFEEIEDWLQGNHIKILDINANMQFDAMGLFGKKIWYFQFFIVDYVEDESISYGCLYDYDIEGLFSKSEKKINMAMEGFVGERKVIFNMPKREHVTMPDGIETYVRFMIYEK